MALSDIERDKRYKIIHTMESMFDSDIMKYDTSESIPMNEEADTRMKDLKDIQDYLADKKLPYLGTHSYSKVRGAIKISLLFMSTKECKVSENDNFLSFGLDIPRDSDRSTSVRVNAENCALESFIGLPKKVESPDVKNISEIIKECNVIEIYNIYQRNALDLVRMRMPAAYNMFNSSSLIKRMDATPGTTLYVYFDKRFNKFHFAYNPAFILECALDEWYLNNSSYDSLVNCYIYILAFLITHEMMHLIHHNTTSTIDMGDVGGHGIVNIMQDSFINCQIGRVFNRVPGITDQNSMGPVPRFGIGSDITVRAEHNQGFKKFKNVEALVREILSVIFKIAKVDIDAESFGIYVYNNIDLAKFDGADVFVSVDIDPRESALRSNSGIFQKTINEILKVMVKGRVYDKFSKLSDSEKETDKPILSKGTLVQVKGSSIICSVDGYDENSKQYDLVEAEMSNIIKTSMDDRSVLNTPVYTPTDKKFGKRLRRDIRPFDPEDASWIEQNGERDKKTKLSDEEIMNSNTSGPNIIDTLLSMNVPKSILVMCIDKIIKDNNMQSLKDSGADLVDMCIGKDPEECRDILGEIIFEKLSEILQQLSNGLGNVESQGQMPEDSGIDHPVFHIGDIVWVRRLRKFGKIVSINNGKFELEEMEEIGVKVLDDSEFHNSSSGGVV